MATLTVVLADDHSVVREGLKSLIAAEPDMKVVGEASDGLAAVVMIDRLAPDVAVVDVSMPGLNGVEATRRIRQDSPKVKVLALTVHEDRSYLRQILDAGANGYVLKRAASQALIGAIRAIASGGTYIDPGIAAKLVKRPGHGTISSTASADGMSAREEEVLRLIAQGFSNKEIAARLAVSTKSVETYKARCMEKLGLTSRVEIVRFAVQEGWLQG
ncbi:response regulator [Lacipirellula sp.]|uniref:response regulator n=1 Tax=Lacipirellula sp. TaxID=2691419 RepID=UPI003D0B0908